MKWRFIIAAVFALLLIPAVEASHLRGGSLWWESEGGNDVRVHGLIFERASYQDNVALQPGTISPLAQSMTFSDGGTEQFLRKVTYRDDTLDWLAFEIIGADSTAGVTHTLPSASDGNQGWTVRYESSARIGGGGTGHMNNPNQNQRLEASIRLDQGGENPVGPKVLFPPIVQCAMNAPCEFTIPGVSSNGNYRMSTPEEATGFFFDGPCTDTFGWTQPCGSAIDPYSGNYYWSTSGAAMNNNGPTYYSTQIMLEDEQGKTPMDFFIQVVENPPPRPEWMMPPSPCDETLIVEEGTTLSMEARADISTSDTVTVAMLGGPPGASTTSNPGNPGSMFIDWTPGPGTPDDVFIFIASATNGQQSVPCGVSVKVVHNDHPTAAFSYTRESPTTGVPHFFTDLSSDPDGDIVSWEWDFDGDNVVDSTEQHPEWSYSSLGSYTVTLTVEDDWGVPAIATDVVDIVNQPPTADFEKPGPLKAGESATYHDLSNDPDGGPLVYEWNFGDGTTSNLQSPSHSFAKAGAYGVCLRVTDSHDYTAVVCKPVIVENQLPTVTITHVPSQPAATTYYKNGFIANAQDEDGEIVSIDWTFGDGEDGKHLEVAHEYEATGTYTVTVTVQDDNGGQASASMEVDITNNRPVARFNFYRETGDPEGFVRFQSDAHDVETSNMAHAWDIDGTPYDLESPSHQFPEPSTPYSVSLKVTDAEGATSAARFVIRPDTLEGDPDTDSDGVVDHEDVCPTVADDQSDMDRDGIGDACDDDLDGDGVANGDDHFPTDQNESRDWDNDGIGDHADPDDDNDGVSDEHEAGLGTDSRSSDSDGDGTPDGVEVDAGTDPRDPMDPAPLNGPANLTLTETGAILSWLAGDHRVDRFEVWQNGTLVAVLPNDQSSYDVEVAWGDVELRSHLTDGTMMVQHLGSEKPQSVEVSSAENGWWWAAPAMALVLLGGAGAWFVRRP